jgi:hypothetical protein
MMHLLVFIFGFTGILGKLISLDAGPLVFWRVAIGGAAVTGVRRAVSALETRLVRAGIGCVVTGDCWELACASGRGLEASAAAWERFEAAARERFENSAMDSWSSLCAHWSATCKRRYSRC